MKLRRLAAGTAKTVALVMVFIVALAAGVILHLGLSAPHRFVQIRVNEVLATSFRGTVEILRYGRIRLGRIDGIEAEVKDPDGERVLYADGASVRIDVSSLLRSFFSKGALLVPIDEVVVDAGEVILDEDHTGAYRLARAFEPREPSKEGGRPVEISIDEVELRHVWAHGRPTEAAVVDADLMMITGSFQKSETATLIDIVSATVQGRGNPGLDPSGTVTGSLRLPPDGAGDLDAEARFAGSLGGIEVVADGSVRARTVAATLDVHASPEAIRAAVPSVEPRDTVHAYARVEGELPVLHADAHASVGSGTIDVAGSVELPEDDDESLAVQADVEVNDLDASALHRQAPPTRATANLRAEILRTSNGSLRGGFALKSQTSIIQGNVVPALSVSGSFTDETVIAIGRVAEPGAPTEVSVSAFRRAGGGGDVHFTVATVVPDLAAIERVKNLGRGHVVLFVNGQVTLDDRSLIGRVSANLENIDAKGVRLGFATLDARAEGPIASPTFVVAANGAAVQAGGYSFTGFRARAEGTPASFDVDARLAGDAASPSVSAAAHVSVKDGFAADSVRIGLRRADVDARITARSIRVRDGEVEVEGGRVEGLGSPISADARFGRGTLTLRASTSRLELDRLSRLFAREEDVHGYVAFDTDVTVSKERAKGKVSLDVAGVEARGYGKVTGRLDVAIDDRTLRGTAQAELGDAGSASVTMSPLVVGGSLLSLDAWTRATGLIDARATLYLDKALALVPKERRPVSAAAGRVTLQLRASRDRAADLPDVDGQVLSTGLALASKVVETPQPDGTVLATLPAWQLRGIDGTLRFDVTGKTGHSVVEARVRDTRGLLVSADATGDLPLRPLIDRPREALRTIEQTPLEVSVKVPRRSVTTLPEMIGHLPFEGDIELQGTLRGTLKKPRLDVTARAHELQFSAGKLACEHPIDANAKVAYDGRKATIGLAASTRGRNVLEGDAAVDLDLPAVLERRAEPWEASGQIRLTKLPLEVLQTFIHKPVRGTVTGKIEVASLGRSPTLSATLDLDEVTIDRAPLPHGNATISMKDGKLDASLALQQPDGRADIRASGLLEGSGSLFPKLSRTQPITASLSAKSFRLHVLRPFVQGTIDSLDGRVDADVKATIMRGGADGKVEGALAIRDGVFSSPQIGERFNKIKGRITMNPWGTLRLDGFSAEARTGRLTAGARAVFDGFALKSANAKIVIKEGESIPITVQGVPMGRAYGTVVASAAGSPDKKRLDVKVDVPLLEVDLPKTKGAKPQKLALDPHIRTGVRNGRTFHPVALAPPDKPRKRPAVATRVTVELGKHVRVRKVGLVDVTLRGRVVLELDGETRVTGRIRVARGELQLQGKRFVIDRANVSFVGDDPANPMVIATAYWDAPEGTRVFADFRGTPKDGKLTLRSDPSYTEDQIIALLMFGSPDGTFGSGQAASEVAQGVSAGGGIITQGLNEVIADTTDADITTRVDTSDASNPKPEVAIQISSRVTARFGVKVGVPGPGDNPDRASVTFDWRFFRNWAVSAEVGDQGSTAVDVVWRFRY